MTNISFSYLIEKNTQSHSRFHTHPVRQLVDIHNHTHLFLHGQPDCFPDAVQVHAAHQQCRRRSKKGETICHHPRQCHRVCHQERKYRTINFTKKKDPSTRWARQITTKKIEHGQIDQVVVVAPAHDVQRD